MAVPKLRKVLTAEFPEQTTWIGRLLSPLNQFMVEVVGIFDKGIRFSDNVAGQSYTIAWRGTAQELPWEIGTLPAAAWIGKVELNGAAVTPAGGLHVVWEFTTNGTFKVSDIVGITGSVTNTYDVTIIVIAE